MCVVHRYIYNTFDFTLVAILLRYLLYIFVYVCLFNGFLIFFYILLYFIILLHYYLFLFIFPFNLHIPLYYIYITYDYFSVLFIYCSSLLLSYNIYSCIFSTSFLYENVICIIYLFIAYSIELLNKF